jgi:probable HAF family extracellular repeat protein
MQDRFFQATSGCAHRTRHLLLAATVIALASSLASCGGGGDGGSGPVAGAQFTAIGFLAGQPATEVTALSSDGSVAAGVARGTGNTAQAFRWAAGVLSSLGPLAGGTRTQAYGVSGDGSVVAGTGDTSSDPATSSAAIRWVAAGSAFRIPALADSSLCSAGPVSGDGLKFAGTCLTLNGNEAFVWSEAAGVVGLGKFGPGLGAGSTAIATSKNGAVVAGAGHPSKTGAMLWNLGGATLTIGMLPGDASSIASAVSRDGGVVAGTSDDSSGTHHAWRWTQQAGLVALRGDIAGFSGSSAAGVSGNGNTVVGSADTAIGSQAFIWDEAHGLRTLESALANDYGMRAAGWKLTRATSISDDGRVIGGSGTDPDGKTQAWIVKLPV